MIEEKIINELSEYFKLTREETFYKLSHSWEIYLNKYKEFNPTLTQEENFDAWFSVINNWYSYPEVHIFEQSWFRYEMEPKEELDKYLSLYKGKVLDFGCGISRFSLQALEEKRCEEVVLVDSSSSIREFLTWVVKKRNLENVTILSELPEVRKFDRIFLLDVLEHLPDPFSLCLQLKQYLGDEGMFVGAAPFHETFQPGHLKRHRYLKLYDIFRNIGLQDSQFKDMTR